MYGRLELHERYEKNIQGQLSCFDRILLFGTFGNIAYPGTMAWELKQANCKFIDYGKSFANELPLQMSDHVKELAAEEGIIIEHVNRAVRKESVVVQFELFGT